jgi:ribosomal protein S18 acetylase RimI-like enzyme
VKTIRFWEEVNANIWPVFESFLYDGWLLRITRGYSRNSNSVWPLYDGELPIGQKIRFCERQYATRGMTCGFRLTDIPENRPIEHKLKELGYTSDNPNLVMVNISMKNAAGEISEMGLEEWMETIYRIHPGDREIKKWEQKFLGKISLPNRYAVVKKNGEACGYGRSVQQGNILNIEKIWVHAKMRNQGFGTQLIQGLLGLGMRDGAEIAYVTVNQSNMDAQRLYGRLGFETKYSYHYFVPQNEAD